MWAERNTVHFRVWRSLVSRLNGVQEAASSNLVTRTNAEYWFSILCVFFVLLPQRTSGLLGAKRRLICRRLAGRSRQAASSNLVTRTNAEYRFSILCVFFVLLPQRTSGLLGAKRRSIRRRPVRTIRPATVRSTRSTLLSSEYALRHTATTANMIPICSIQMENILTERKDPTVNTIRRRII